MILDAVILKCDNCGKERTAGVNRNRLVEEVTKRGWAIERDGRGVWCEECWSVGSCHWDTEDPVTDANGNGLDQTKGTTDETP